MDNVVGNTGQKAPFLDRLMGDDSAAEPSQHAGLPHHPDAPAAKVPRQIEPPQFDDPLHGLSPEQQFMLTVLEQQKQQQQRADAMMQAMLASMSTQQQAMATIMSQFQSPPPSLASLASSSAAVLPIQAVPLPQPAVATDDKALPPALLELLTTQRNKFEKLLWKNLKTQQRRKNLTEKVTVLEDPSQNFPHGIPALHLPAGPPELLDIFHMVKDDSHTFSCTIEKNTTRSAAISQLYRWTWSCIKSIEVEAVQEHEITLKASIAESAFTEMCSATLKDWEKELGANDTIDGLLPLEALYSPLLLDKEVTRLLRDANDRVRARWQKATKKQDTKDAAKASNSAISAEPEELLKEVVDFRVREVCASYGLVPRQGGEEDTGDHMDSSDERDASPSPQRQSADTGKESAKKFVQSMQGNGQSPGGAQGLDAKGKGKDTAKERNTSQHPPRRLPKDKGKGKTHKKGKSDYKGKSDFKKGKSKGKGKGEHNKDNSAATGKGQGWPRHKFFPGRKNGDKGKGRGRV